MLHGYSIYWEAPWLLEDTAQTESRLFADLTMYSGVRFDSFIHLILVPPLLQVFATNVLGPDELAPDTEANLVSVNLAA